MAATGRNIVTALAMGGFVTDSAHGWTPEQGS